jgi:hypothetical protein
MPHHSALIGQLADAHIADRHRAAHRRREARREATDQPRSRRSSRRKPEGRLAVNALVDGVTRSGMHDGHDPGEVLLTPDAGHAHHRHAGVLEAGVVEGVDAVSRDDQVVPGAPSVEAAPATPRERRYHCSEGSVASDHLGDLRHGTGATRDGVGRVDLWWTREGEATWRASGRRRR